LKKSLQVLVRHPPLQVFWRHPQQLSLKTPEPHDGPVKGKPPLPLPLPLPLLLLPLLPLPHATTAASDATTASQAPRCFMSLKRTPLT
jgi:hypothetical protein